MNRQTFLQNRVDEKYPAKKNPCYSFAGNG